MLASLSQVGNFWVLLCQRLGLAFLFLGVFLERPVMFAASILALLIAMPLHQLFRRLVQFKFELVVIIGLITVQWGAESQFNALILMIYLMGLINGLLLPNPNVIAPRSLVWVIALVLLLSLFFTSDLPRSLGIISEESIFGVNQDDYKIDTRSLAYAAFIVLLYLAPHFRGKIYPRLHASLLVAVSVLAMNKFGILYAALYRLTPRLVFPLVLSLFFVLEAIGFSNFEFTAPRLALWADFFYNFPFCKSKFGACTELITLNNVEGVRSFHSIVLDFYWYGGVVGLLAGIYFLARVAVVRSSFGASSSLLFAIALLFGFPPFFNERHILIVYAFLVLFKAERSRRLSYRAL